MTTLLSVNNYYYPRGGSEAVFFGHNRAFADFGWKVVPFAMKHPENLASEWSEYFIANNELDGMFSIAKKLAMTPTVIYSFEARRNLSRLLNSATPDICHAHNIYHHLTPSILGLLKRRGVPTVLTLHDLKIACPAYTMLTHDGICERCRGGHISNVLIHRCIKNSAAMSAILMIEAGLHRLLGSYSRCVDRFIVPSRFYIEKLCEWDIARSSLVHVPNFVDAEHLRPSYHSGQAVLYFGRVSREKGLATLIRAASVAQSTVWIAGTGPDLDEMRRLAAQLDADVTFLGYLSGEKLHDVVRSCRAVVLPSEWYENAPMSILEAYGLGKPVVGAMIGGIPELIRQNETGLGFESGNVDALATALRTLMDLPDSVIEAMGRVARAWVEQAFSRDLYRDRLLDTYAGLGVTSYVKS
jgi:glycosyltransferase involved in cell wall biosynthesis